MLGFYEQCCCIILFYVFSMEWTQHTFLLVSARSKVGIFSIWEDTLNYFWSICKDWSVRERELGTKTGQGVWAGRDCVRGEMQEMESDCKAGPLQYLAKQWWPDGEATRGTWILRRKIIWPGLHIWKTHSAEVQRTGVRRAGLEEEAGQETLSPCEWEWQGAEAERSCWGWRYWTG